MSDAAYPIHIDVTTRYLEGQAPDEQKFAFAYYITIHNRGTETVQLLNRYWLITDGNAKVTEVQGPGVIGQQPHIAAGSKYQYSSGAILDTPVGSMQGYYEMRRFNGELFKATIPLFSLAVPHMVN